MQQMQVKAVDPKESRLLMQLPHTHTCGKQHTLHASLRYKCRKHCSAGFHGQRTVHGGATHCTSHTQQEQYRITDD